MSVNKMFTTAYTKEIDEDERSVVAWGSQAIVDRTQEIIKGSAWDLKSFKQHPVIMLSHRYDQLWIGKALWVKTNKEGLLFKAQFAKTAAAEEAFQLVKDTGIAAFSVGFIPKKWKDFPEEKGNGDNPRRIYTECELLEISLVGVPACPTALLLAYRDGKVKTKSLIDAAKGIEDSIVEIEESDDKVKLGDEAVGKIEDENICKEVILKPEETDDSIRLPVKGEEGKHGDHKIRWITVSEEKGIKGLYCIDCKKIITYIFDKKKGWTMAKAKKWMKDHGKDVHIEETVNALTGKLGLYIIYDGKDFVEDLDIIEPEEKELEEEEIKEEPETEDPIKWIKELTEEVRTLKEGRVLSGKNLKLVKDCKEQIDLVGELLNKLIVASEPPKEESILPLIEESKSKDNGLDSLTSKDMPVIIEEVLKGLKEGMSGQHKEIQKLFDNKRGKVS